MHSQTSLLVSQRLHLPSLGAQRLSKAHLPQIPPKVCLVFPEPLGRQTLLAPQQLGLASTHLWAELGPALSCQFNVPFHHCFLKKHDLHSPFHNKS